MDTDKTRWCEKKGYWRSVAVCERRALQFDIKACQKCWQDYVQLRLPFKPAAGSKTDVKFGESFSDTEMLTGGSIQKVSCFSGKVLLILLCYARNT